MRRTYRSRKDTASGIERRDLFQNLDEKSSAYDAFSIHNIKQTKRELSCVGSSNALGVASSRVRKKKYVRRIVKEPETPCRESMSRSAYLTPDKSIHVNKPLDPFDLLLISSPACPSETKEKNVETITKKVDLFDHLVPKKEGKTYTRRKAKIAKKFNYSSSENSDSDKENSDEKPNLTQNSSDIRSHKLLVEHEVNTSPNIINDSINKIVNNLSLINKIKNTYNANESINKSFRLNKHRLTRNIQSPLLQKSPLCSTPFKMKYRGDSIFKFSPIVTTQEDKSPKYTTISEDNDDNNCSIILLCSSKRNSPKIPEENTPKAAVDNIERDTNKERFDFEQKSEVANPEVSYKEKELTDTVSDNKPISSIEISSFQTTECEPFFGFSQSAINEVIAQNKNFAISISDMDETVAKSVSIQIDNCDNDVCLEEENNDVVPENDISKECVHISTSENDQSNEISDNTNEDRTGEDETDNDNSSLHSTDEENNSLYDTCTSEQSSLQEEQVVKKPIVVLEKMNDSAFFKYYDEIRSECSETEESNDSIQSEFASFKGSNNSQESVENASEIESEDIVANEADDSIEENEANDSNDQSSSNNEEEKCVSFVTTRRRNELTNNSMLSMFNDSYGSSSTDCDKTVLSNYKNINKSSIINDALDNNDSLDLGLNNVGTEKDDNLVDVNKDSEPPDIPTMDQEPRISFVTTRNSNITDRKSCVQARKSSVKSRNSTVSFSNPKMPMDSFKPDPDSSRMSCIDSKPGIVLQPGKKWERSLSIYRRMTMMTDHFDRSILEEEPIQYKGRKYRQSVISTMEMQELNSSLHNESFNSRRSTFVSKPSRSRIRIVKDPNCSRLSLCNTTVFDDLTGFLNEECDDTIIELSKLSIADQTHEVTVLDNFHDTSNRITTARDYVLRRCNQTDAILFDECYPDTVLKNCHKIGEGVYGEVFLWRDRDGRARVLKIVPIAGNLKVNGESQKDFHEIISEIVIAMELSALRAPIAEIERHFDEGKDVEALDLHAIENATDVFNEVLAVRCVYGSYPSRLLDLWDLYDECKGSENDNPAILPLDQQFMVLELANAGQDLESYQFNNAEQAHALFLQVAYGLAVAEEAYQFEHRDLHWGNVLIAPTEQKYATFVIRGRAHRVLRCGVRGTVIDYSLSRVALRLAAGDAAALYNDLANDESLFEAVGDYQFQVYRLMRDKLGNDWKSYEPYTNILWLHYTVDKMITALRYKRINTKIHKHYIDKLKGIKSRILDYGSAALFVLTDNEI